MSTRFLKAESDPILWKVLSVLRLAFSGRGAFVTSLGILASVLTILVIMSPQLQAVIASALSPVIPETTPPIGGTAPASAPTDIGSGSKVPTLGGALSLSVALFALALMSGGLLATAWLQLSRSLSAKDYAYFVVGNSPVTSALLITSHHIQGTVRRFRHVAEAFETFMQNLAHKNTIAVEKPPGILLRGTRILLRGVVSATWIPTPGGNWLSTAWYRVLARVFGVEYLTRWSILKLQPDFQRIAEMNKLIEKDHGISLHQQRDALLYFDPEFFAFVTHQVLTNTEILCEPSILDQQRIRLQQQCDGAIELARRCEKFQARVQNTTALLPYVVRIARVNAMTLGCTRLSRAIALVCRTTLHAAGSQDVDKEVLHFGYQAIRHLSWQARAHVGVHLIDRLAVILDGEKQGGELLKFLCSHTSPVEPTDDLNATPVDPGDPFETANWRVADPDRVNLWRTQMQRLASAPRSVAERIESDRVTLRTELCTRISELKSRLTAKHKNVVLVITGFSSTVRDAVEYLITSKELEHFSELSILVTRAGDDDGLQARAFANEVRHKYRRSQQGTPSVRIFTADKAGTIGMADESTAVICLLGAELVDESNRSLQHRDVGSNILKEFFVEGKRKDGRIFEAWILAEQFKHVPSIYECSRTFGFHLARVWISHSPQGKAIGKVQCIPSPAAPA